MKYFKELLDILIEGKVSELESRHPDIPVRKYAEKDTSKTKKFLPWLISQHKKGNVTPEHPDLEVTLNNFDKTKDRSGILDHTGHDYSEISNAVHKYMGRYKSLRRK